MLTCSQNTTPIAVLGGSFDPPHFAHIAMIIEAIESNFCNRVIITPSPIRWDKKQSASTELRLRACTEVCNMLNKLGYNTEVDPTECLNDNYRGSYTYLKELECKLNQKVKFLIGEDSLQNIYLWRDITKNEMNGEKLLNEFTIGVFKREPLKILSEFKLKYCNIKELSSLNNIAEQYPNIFPYTNIEKLSSTAIRNNLANNVKTRFSFTEVEQLFMQ